MSGSNHLQRQITSYKELLANLSRKNRELYYKESTGSSINLSRFPFPANALLENKTSDFSPAKVADLKFSKVFSGDGDLNLHEHFEIDLIKDAVAVKKLYGKLDKIRLSDDRHQREFGISGAWLLGPFLCWRTSSQSPRDELLISPIFKVPIDLAKNKKKQIILKAESDDVFFNPSLLLALKQAIGLNISVDSKFENIQEALNFFKAELGRFDKKVNLASDSIDCVPQVPKKVEIIKDENGDIIERRLIPLEEALSAKDLQIYDSVTGQEFLLIDVVYMDQLNASRMVLIKDYDEIIDSGIDHKILNELFNGTPLAEEPPTDRSKLKELDAYKERENFFVVDIDSTQHRAIDKATKSNAIVIQGPPGSGKSQTIVNLIADYLAKGKKVLFVSEKRPALDVVYNRMKGANIESQAVLIHSSDLNKSDLYKSFLTLAGTSPDEVSEKEWNSLTESLDQTKIEMNQYSSSLSNIHTPSGLQNAELIVAASHVDKKLFSPNLFLPFSNLNYENLTSFRRELETVQALLVSCPDFDSSPWKYRNANAVRTMSLEHKLNDLRMRYQSVHDEEMSLKDLIQQETGEAYVGEESRTISQIVDYSKMPENYTLLWTNNRKELQQALKALTLSLNSLSERLEKNKLAYMSISSDCKPDMVDELETYYKTSQGPLKWFSGKFWEYRKIRQQVCPKWDGTSLQFSGYKEYAKIFEELRILSDSFSSLVPLNQNEHSKSISWVTDQVVRLQKLSTFFAEAEIKLPKKMRTNATDSLEGFNQTIASIEKVKGAMVKLKNIRIESEEYWSALSEFVSSYPVLTNNSDRILFLNDMIDGLANLEILDKADIVISKVAKRFAVEDLKNIINRNLSGLKCNWADLIESTLLSVWVDELITNEPILRSFSRERIHSLVEDFKKG
jgi:hypothetical protein